jgi:RNA polymerase sigma-70 factor (ECF subfamily)
MPADTVDAKTLVARYQRGDRKALEQLLEQHRDRAYRFAYRLTRHHDDAEDITADAFVRAHRCIDSYKGNAAFSTWLCRIVLNCFLDARKKAKPDLFVSLDAPSHDDQVARLDNVAAREMSPHIAAERAMGVKRLVAAMQELPDYQRAILLLYHVEMLTYEQIGEMLGLPLGTVKSRLNRARVNLRDLIAEDLELLGTAYVS